MSRLFSRRTSLPAEVSARAGLRRGDRVLAHARASDGRWLLGTREALVVVADEADEAGTPLRIPWARVASADWDRDEDALRVVEVADFGEAPPVHVFTLADPGPLLPMVRERVTASVLLTRRTQVEPGRGLLVVGRRTPGTDEPVGWSVELDEGLDPDHPLVRAAAEDALAGAQDELGPGIG